MAASKNSIKELLNAESVAGNLIVGERLNRVIVGRTDENGIFELTEEGRELVEAVTNPKKQAKKNSKVKVEESSETEAE